MGSYRSSLFAAPLLLAMPVHAQQTEEAAPPTGILQPAPAPPADANRQGPELDVFRAPATAAPPPVVVPTVIPTPVPVPAPARPAPRPARPAPATTQPRPAPAPAVQPAEAAPETPTSSAPLPQPQPASPQPAPAEPAAPPTVPAPVTNGPFWQWIIGGALALLALVAALRLLRRKDSAPEAEAEAPPAPAPVIVPPTAPPPEPAPPPAPIPVAVPEATDRPWLDIALDVTQARFSMLGLTVHYVLRLHNRGDQPAQDIMVRGIIGNAGDGQQDLLQSFLGGHVGMPLHAVVGIAPGETHRLPGELRLSPDQIQPVAMGQRSLLIPLAAFDAAYRWGPEDGDPAGTGRAARAFIVGQEQEPPADRLAPLRLDQGPRQYRRPASRVAAQLTPA